MAVNFITRILIALDKRSHCTNKQKYGHRETAEKAVEAMAKKARTILNLMSVLIVASGISAIRQKRS